MVENILARSNETVNARIEYLRGLNEWFERLIPAEMTAGTRECGTVRKYGRNARENVAGTANRAVEWFCRGRWCAICDERRSDERRMEIERIATQIGQEYEWLFVTLTTENVAVNVIADSVQLVKNGWELMRRRLRRAGDIGWLSAVEVCVNPTQLTLWAHVHTLLCVPPMFDWSVEDWRAAWRGCLKASYLPVVKVEKARDIGSVAAYVGSFAKVLGDVRKISNEAVARRVMSELVNALKGVRLIEWGGVLRKIREKLNKSLH